MKTIYKSKLKKLAASLLAICFVLSSCQLQSDHDYVSETIDPHVDMTAWEFINSRPDVFSRLVEVLEYTGLDRYYKQTEVEYTFLTLNNAGIKAYNDNVETGKKLEDWDKVALTKMLKYHIVEGNYNSYEFLPVEPIFVVNLLRGEEKGLMTMMVRKSPWQQNVGKIVINEEGSNGTSPTRQSVTTNIMPTNGVIHVFENYCFYKQ